MADQIQQEADVIQIVQEEQPVDHGNHGNWIDFSASQTGNNGGDLLKEVRTLLGECQSKLNFIEPRERKGTKMTTVKGGTAGGKIPTMNN